MFFIKPLFDFFWTYIINFEAKFLYFKWNKNKKNFFDLNDANHLMYQDKSPFGVTDSIFFFIYSVFILFFLLEL